MRTLTATIVMMVFAISAIPAGAVQWETSTGTNVLTPVTSVWGKEYSDQSDKDAAGTADSLQNVWFDGAGGAQNAFDYTGSNGVFLATDQVDALANSQDAFYWDVANDTVPMLLSRANQPDIEYQMAGTDSTGVWATPSQINSVSSTPLDVDGLEVWNSDGGTEPPASTDDATMFSLVGDPGGWSVYRYNSVTQTAAGYITSGQIDNAIALGGMPDVDALVVWDSEDNGIWDTGDSIIFSIQPAGIFAGGEVWLWQYGQFANFMTYGGERWYTAHTVGLDFGFGGENVDALEAVPEPAMMALLGLGGLAMIRRRK